MEYDLEYYQIKYYQLKKSLVASNDHDSQEIVENINHCYRKLKQRYRQEIE